MSNPPLTTPEKVDVPGVPDHYFDRGISLDVVRHHFRQGRHIIRIAAGFFTVRGYNLLRSAAAGKKLLLLVGIEEPGKESARQAMVQDILRDLRTGLDIDRRVAVRELVEKMGQGNLRVIDARALAHHAKLYIVDEAVVLVASANVSGRGLQVAIEAGAIVENAEAVRHYISQYEAFYHAPECVDITAELLAALRGWLEFARPWDVYLKTLLALEALDETHLQRPAYKKPVSYQRDVVARALRQIEAHGGAFIVASTGLGKTVIGTDIALRLQERGVIRNVLLVGPKATRESWERHLRSGGLSFDYFVHQALDTASEAHNHDVAVLKSILETMDGQWLVIIDESHQMRNRYQEKLVKGKPRTQERLVFQRLAEAISSSHCKVILLTGTPYSKDVENVNNQLFLLPQTSPIQTALFEEYAGFRPWRIDELSQLKEAPVSSVLTTPYVARHYGTQDERGVYVSFGGQHRYVPRILLYRTDFPVLLDSEMSAVISQRLFRKKNRNPKYSTTIENEARTSWVSSPWALREVLTKSSNGSAKGGYPGEFLYPLETRREQLVPLLQSLKAMAWADDAKLLALCALLDQIRRNEATKAIIFVERLATAVYLEQALHTLRPALRVACTVTMDKPGKKIAYHLKPAREMMRLLETFAPIANERPLEASEEGYDIFLTTDAMGVGVNMQDARVIINYDLAWTPIEPTQRAGRVLRFWHEPRVAELHTFVPCTAEQEVAGRANHVLRRWQKLTERDGQARQILDMPSLATQSPGLLEPSVIDLQALVPPAGIKMSESQLLGEVDLDALANEAEKQDVSAVFRHAAILERNKSHAIPLPDDLLSVRLHSGLSPLIFVLLRCEGKYHWPVYDIQQWRLSQSLSDTQLLDLIQCSEDEPVAWEDQDKVEEACDMCIKAWCRDEGIPADNVTRICALYLKPRTKTQSLDEWLRTQRDKDQS